MIYKYIENGIIEYIGESNKIPKNGVVISEIEKGRLEMVIQSKPIDTLESIYRLSAETNQYEPFTRTHDETVEWYVQAVLSDEITLDEVPTDYKAEVEEIINIEPTYSEDYLNGYDQAILDMMGVE